MTVTFQKAFHLAIGLFLAMQVRGENSPCKIRLIAAKSGPPQIEVSYVDEEEKPVQKSVPAVVVPRGTPLYHWTKNKRAYRGWVSAGRVPEATMTAINANERAAGGGVYVSTSVWDSHSYGNHLILLEAPHDLILFPFELYEAVGPECRVSLDAKKLMNAGFDGVHDQPETWMALVNPRATSKVKGLGDTSTVLGAIHDLTLCELAELDEKMPLVPNDALARYHPTLYKVLSNTPLRRKERDAMLGEIQESLKVSSGMSWEPANRSVMKRPHCGEYEYQASFLKKLKRRVEASRVKEDADAPPTEDSEPEHT